MKPIDFRDATWESVQGSMAGRLMEVYRAWVVYGEGTTRQLAQRSGIDILNVRPRTTDLFGIGLVELVGGNAGEGIYKARNRADWESWLERERESVVSGQLNLI